MPQNEEAAASSPSRWATAAPAGIVAAMVLVAEAAAEGDGPWPWPPTWHTTGRVLLRERGEEKGRGWCRERSGQEELRPCSLAGSGV